MGRSKRASRCLNNDIRRFKQQTSGITGVHAYARTIHVFHILTSLCPGLDIVHGTLNEQLSRIDLRRGLSDLEVGDRCFGLFGVPGVLNASRGESFEKQLQHGANSAEEREIQHDRQKWHKGIAVLRLVPQIFGEIVSFSGLVHRGNAPVRDEFILHRHAGTSCSLHANHVPVIQSLDILRGKKRKTLVDDLSALIEQGNAQAYPV